MMSSTNDEDPFLQVQQDVLSALQQTRPLFSSYLRIRSLNPTSTSPELTSARSDLESALSSLADDLSDLVESVRAVESNPARFGLTAAEVTRRKRLVQDVSGEIEDMREELLKQTSSSSPAKSGNAAHGKSGSRDGDLPDPSSFAIPDGEGGDAGGEDYAAEFEQQQQVQMMREQDEHLDGVFQTVGNLRQQAADMGRELEEQREMLEVVDDLADRVGGRLQNGMQKLQKIARANEDRWSGFCIGLLILVLIILLVLLLIL